MRGGTKHRGLWLGVLVSAAMHLGVGMVASSIPMAAGSGSRVNRAGVLDGTLLTFDPIDNLPSPATAPPDDTVQRPAVMLAPAPPQPHPTPEEIEQKLVLGIEESDQKTKNWLGSNTPTEHRAPLSDVEQPQLDPNPGSPGLPSLAGVAATPMQGPLLPELLPKPTATPEPPSPVNPAATTQEGADTPERSQPKLDRPEGPKLQDGKHDVPDSPSTRSGREGERDGTGEKLVQPVKGSPETPKLDPNLPGPKPLERGPAAGREKPKTPEPKTPETPRLVEAAKASAPAERPAPKSSSSPSVPAVVNGSPDAASVPPSPATGSGGDRPGEKSAKEADASSTTPSIEIRPGMPAAAQGLDITTKRPYFTRLTRATAFPGNPLLKVTFNRSGVVTKVVLIESSGVSDVDGPIINAIYQWTAKGKTLAELAPGDVNAGITLSVRILLR